MKKLNNKGFAISTIIYGLAIMIIMIVAILMATMAQNRSNTKELAKQIEDELNRYTKTETAFLPKQNASNMPTYQEYVVPEDGWYRIELWGSQGAGSNGGRGAYTSGVIELTKGETLYFYVGAHNSSGNIGRATDVRVTSGDYAAKDSYETRIMIAAGGGTNADAAGGTLYGYSSKMKSYGGYIDVSSSNPTFGLLGEAIANPTNKTLVGYDKNFQLETSVTGVGKVGVAIPAPTGTNGGGDGFWPSSNNQIGGVSYIAGYSGTHGLEKGITTNHSRYSHYAKEYVESEGTGGYQYTTHLRDYYFVDGLMLPGVNQGDGHAQIELVARKKGSGQALTKKNTKLNNVRYIKECIPGSSNALLSSWGSIYATAEGVTLTRPTSLTILDSEPGCRRYELMDYPGEASRYPRPVAGTTRVYNLDEIAMFHNPGTDYKNITVSVSRDGSNWITIKDKSSSTNYSTTDTPTGLRISAYQYDSTAAIPDKGEYIIFPVLYEAKTLTAAESASQEANAITAEYYNGYKRQRWLIEKIANGEYKIVEQARFKALNSIQDENIPMNIITANSKFNSYARNEPQIWNVVAVGNGTYIIKTIVAPFSSSVASGYILPQSNQTATKKNQLIIGKNNADTARFTLFSVNYSAS